MAADFMIPDTHRIAACSGLLPVHVARSGKSRGDMMRRPVWWRLLVEGSIMATKNPTPDDSGVMLIAVLAILASRIDAP